MGSGFIRETTRRQAQGGIAVIVNHEHPQPVGHRVPGRQPGAVSEGAAGSSVESGSRTVDSPLAQAGGSGR